MTEISGTVQDAGGSLISGATVWLVRESDHALVGVTTTDSLGEFLFGSLSSTETYHVAASYNDGSTEYNGKSFPFIDPFSSTGPIDDFEDDNIVEYNGDELSFDVQSAVNFEGALALEMGNDDGNQHEIRSLSGLPRYPSEEGAFQYRVRLRQDSTSKIFFGLQDADNHYEASIETIFDTMSIREVVGGSSTSLASESQNIPLAEWLRVKIEWDAFGNDDIIMTLFNEAGTELNSITAVDGAGTFTGGGIGWLGRVDAFSGDSVFYDICELTQAGVDTLPSPGTIDDFEDADIAEYGGETANFSADTARVYEGTYALHWNQNQTGTSSDSISSSTGLPKYPEAGNTFQCRMYSTDGFDQNGFHYFTQEEVGDPDGYMSYANQFKNNTDVLEIFRHDSGGYTKLVSASVDHPSNTWFRYEIQTAEDGSMTATTYSGGSQIATVSTTDTTYSAGGIGWRMGNGDPENNSDAYGDLAEITA